VPCVRPPAASILYLRTMRSPTESLGNRNQCRNDERVVAALTSAIKNTREAAMHAIRSLEVALHDVARRRAAAPFASLMFAFALGLTACCAVIWSAYHAGTGYGYDLGYRADTTTELSTKGIASDPISSSEIAGTRSRALRCDNRSPRVDPCRPLLATKLRPIIESWAISTCCTTSPGQS